MCVRQAGSKVLRDENAAWSGAEPHLIRGCLELPIVEREETLVFGVWVRLSQASTRRAQEVRRSGSL